MHRPRVSSLVSSVVFAVVLVAAGCSSTPSNTSAVTTVDASVGCPTTPVDVVVTINQWGDLVEQLGGGCVRVTTVISSAAIDPHEYEPTTADTASFTSAALVVENGLAYDAWADKAIDTLANRPAVVNAGEVTGKTEGDNPHLWYGPAYLEEVANAVTGQLKQLVPEAATYFDAQSVAWDASMQPFRDEIARVRARAPGKTYGATESVFDDMAEALGLTNVTPSGYQNAAANESDPSPGDIAAFNTALEDKTMTVLIYNVQTQGSIPEQLRGVAEHAGVPVVEVTESVPDSAGSFVEWQIGQLQALGRALEGS